jgi:hypothetical protein
MRKKVLSLATIVVLLAAAAVAYAQQTQQNVYNVTASTSPTKAGTSTKPVNIGLSSTTPSARPTTCAPAVVEKYSIRFAGLRVNTNAFPQCTAAQINDAGNDEGCPAGALVGTGEVENRVGGTNNVADQSIECFLRLKVYNVRNNRATLYLYGGPNATPACPTEIAVAIAANYVKPRLGDGARVHGAAVAQAPDRQPRQLGAPGAVEHPQPHGHAARQARRVLPVRRRLPQQPPQRAGPVHARGRQGRRHQVREHERPLHEVAAALLTT